MQEDRLMTFYNRIGYGMYGSAVFEQIRNNFDGISNHMRDPVECLRVLVQPTAGLSEGERAVLDQSLEAFPDEIMGHLGTYVDRVVNSGMPVSADGLKAQVVRPALASLGVIKGPAILPGPNLPSGSGKNHAIKYLTAADMQPI